MGHHHHGGGALAHGIRRARREAGRSGGYVANGGYEGGGREGKWLMAILFCIVVPPLGLFQLLLLSITPSPKELARREAAQRHAASPPSVLTPTSRAIFAASGLTDEQIESLFANGLSRELCATNFDSMLAGGWSIEQTAKFVADSYATGVRRAHDRLR